MAREITLKSGLKLFYASDKMISEWLAEDGAGKKALNGPTDLDTGIYEGGLKVWECALDLCNFLDSPDVDLKDLDVLELGCGAGLPSIVALRKGAASVTMQDFNDFVIEAFTKRNFALNEIDPAKSTFIAAKWGNELVDRIGAKRFHLIVTSETIYNELNYEPLVSTLDELLTVDGRILLAAKCFYFGIGGSITAFEEFVNNHGTFTTKEVWSSTKSCVPRKILEIKRK